LPEKGRRIPQTLEDSALLYEDRKKFQQMKSVNEIVMNTLRKAIDMIRKRRLT
jgi:hypothetical protein